MATQYLFITNWKINAPVNKVWDVIYHSTEWSSWWKGVLEVRELQAGDEQGINSISRYTWKSILPYTLSFSMKLTENIYCKKLTGIAFGELEGKGTWIFEEANGLTNVTYFWNVHTTKMWMNCFAFLLKPAFKYNHNVIMQWGEEGLKKKLGIE